jgi:hypothetical protein
MLHDEAVMAENPYRRRVIDEAITRKQRRALSPRNKNVRMLASLFPFIKACRVCDDVASIDYRQPCNAVSDPF